MQKHFLMLRYFEEEKKGLYCPAGGTWWNSRSGMPNGPENFHSIFSVETDSNLPWHKQLASCALDFFLAPLTVTFSIFTQ